MMKKSKMLFTTGCLAIGCMLAGCGDNGKDTVTNIEIVQYKPEATAYFKEVEKEFNEQHEDIKLTISSPNDATTILRTRFIREDYPDIIGIGGDINYSYYVDAGILADLSDYQGIFRTTIIRQKWRLTHNCRPFSSIKM